MKKRNVKRVLALLAALCVLTGCTSPQSRKGDDLHVIFIGIDGWNATCMDKADIPHIRALMDQGCWTTKKRSVLPSSSAMNWCSMFMGVSMEFHGYTTWGSATPEIPSIRTNEHGICPSFYSLLRDERPDAEIGCVYEWGTIKQFIDTLSVNYYEQADMENKTLLCEKAERYIRESHPTLLSVIFDQVDHVGHADGHDTPAYYERLHEVDGYVGRIVDAVREAGMMERTVFIVTSDHGGIDHGHGGITLNELEAPFVICGKDIPANGEIKEAMMQYDVASVVLRLFGIDQPDFWRGKAPESIFARKK